MQLCSSLNILWHCLSWREREREVAQSCPTLCNPVDCSLPGSSVHGIFQARVLELVAISFSRRASQPRDWTWVSRIVGRRFTIWATREENVKECSNYHTITFISHASKVMLKILHASLQQYMYWEIPHVQAGFRKGSSYSLDHWKSKTVPEKHLLLLYWLCQSLSQCGSQQTGKFFKGWEYQTTLPASWEICMHVKKQQLELNMEQQTGFKSGKEFAKAMYCHPAYLT